jgi:hypothetical protein
LVETTVLGPEVKAAAGCGTYDPEVTIALGITAGGAYDPEIIVCCGADMILPGMPCTIPGMAVVIEPDIVGTIIGGRICIVCIIDCLLSEALDRAAPASRAHTQI